jgi:hypothetical protein
VTPRPPHTMIVEWYFWRKRDAVAFERDLDSRRYIAREVVSLNKPGKPRRGAKVRAWPRRVL